MPQSLYDFECTNINSQVVSLEEFRDKVLLIVNTASYCGFTPQYQGLEDLYRQYRERGLVVLGFPSNQFWEEPQNNEKIHQFCVRNYGVTFPLFEKIPINGKNQHPLFEFLKSAAPGFLGTKGIKWNFTKFLVDRHGAVVGRFAPTLVPRYLTNKIEPLLR